MNFSITLGWWLAPLVITAAAFTWANVNQDTSPSGDYGRIGQGLGNAVLFGVALIVSLIAWLIWAVLS